MRPGSNYGIPVLTPHQQKIVIVRPNKNLFPYQRFSALLFPVDA